jgi:hypothetical protein
MAASAQHDEVSTVEKLLRTALLDATESRPGHISPQLASELLLERDSLDMNELWSRGTLPERPYYRHVARNLEMLLFRDNDNNKDDDSDNDDDNNNDKDDWDIFGPAEFDEAMGLNDGRDALRRLQPKSELSWREIAAVSDDRERLDRFKRWILEELGGALGLLTLLGQRYTAGTILMAMPSVSALFEAFERPWRDKPGHVSLTHGARALSKHAHRASSQFWGECKGPAGSQNERALHVLNALLDDCRWLNVHHMPPDNAVFEVRGSQGYGARWYVNGVDRCEFRGFVEPYSKDGHENKWRH